MRTFYTLLRAGLLLAGSLPGIAAATATINLSFTPPTINPGDPSRINISVFNSSLNPLSSAAVTVSLASSVTIASAPAPSDTCGFTASAPAGGSSITLSGGSVPAAVSGGSDGSCTFSVNVASVTAGNHTTNIPVAGFTALDAGSGVSNATAANATLAVNAITAPTGAITFAPSSVYVGEVTQLKIVLTNGDATVTLPLTTVTDSLPAGMVIAPTPAASVACTGAGAAAGSLASTPAGGGSVAAGDTAITLTGGTIGGGGTCTVLVNVVAPATTGTATDSVAANAIGNARGLASAAFSKGLTVNNPISISQAITPAGTIRAGQSVTLKITISNASTTNALSIVSFTDNLGGGLVLSSASSPTVACGGTGAANGTLTAAAGTTSIILVGAAAGTSNNCLITVAASMAAAGTGNSTGATTVGAGSRMTNAAVSPANLVVPASSANVTYASQFTIAKSGPATAYQGQAMTYTVTLNNWSAGAATGVNFTDSLPLGGGVQMVLAAGSSVGAGCTGGTLSGPAGASSLTWTGGTVAAGSGTSAGTCTITILAAMPAAAAVASSFVNNLPAGSAVTGLDNASGAMSNSNAASVTTTTTASVTVAQTFTPTSIVQGNTSVLAVTLTNPTGTALTNTAFGETLNANVSVAAVPGASTTCAGTPVISATPGSGTIGASGLTVPAGGNCKVSVTVTSPNVGAWANTIAIGAITDDQGQSNTSAAAKTLTVTSGLTAAAAFLPASTGLGGSSVLTLTLTNAGAVALTGVSVTEPLPTGANAFVVSATPNASTTCSGAPAITAAAGATSVTMTGASIAAGTSCALSVAITTTASAAASWNLAIPAGNITSTQGAANTSTVSASLTKVSVTLTVNKSFNPVSIVGGAPSVLQIDITNPLGAASAASGVSLTDTFPSGMEVYSNPGASTTCANGVVSASPGASSVSLSGASVAIGTTCSVLVNVTSIKSLNLTNTIGVGAIGSQQGFTNAVATSASLSTLQGVSVEKGFSPLAIAPGQSATLSVRLVSTLNTVALTNVAVTDNLPAGVVVAATPGITSNCGATPVAAAGGSSVSISGVGIAPQANCSFTVKVTSAAVGSYTNTIPIGAATSTEGYANQTAASAPLNVMTAPTVAMAFGTPTIPSGATSQLVLTIANPNSQALLATALADILPTGVSVALTPAAASTCAGASVVAVAAGSSVSVSGATIPANGSCTVSANVTSNTPGAYTNTVAAGAIATAQGVTNTAGASATLTVLQPPTVALAFAPATMAPGATSQLSITLGNANASAISLSSLFTDTLPTSPANLVVATPSGVSTTCPGTATATAGAATATYASGSSIPAGGCVIRFNVTAATIGTYTDTVLAGSLVTSAGSSQAVATAALVIGNNTPPVATAFSASVNDNIVTPQAIGPLSATATAPATISSYAIASLPVAGLGALYCNGSLISSVPSACAANQLAFLPVAGAVGSASFTFTATDSNALTSPPATVSITVNGPPSAAALTLAINNNAASAVSVGTLAATPQGSATVTGFSISSLPGGALDVYCAGVQVLAAPVACAAGAVTVLPVGAPSATTTFQYTATDSNAMHSAPGTITVKFNTPPTANAATATAINASAATAQALPALTGTATTAGATISAFSIASLPAAGTLYCSGVAIAATPAPCAAAALSFKPAGATPNPVTFTFTVTDSNGMTSAAATISIPLVTTTTAANFNSAVNNNATAPVAIGPMSAVAQGGATITAFDVTRLPANAVIYCNGTVMNSVPFACSATGLAVKPLGGPTGSSSIDYLAVNSNGVTSATATGTITWNTPPTANGATATAINENAATAQALPPLTGTATTAGATISAYAIASLPAAGTLYCSGIAVAATPAPCAAAALSFKPAGAAPNPVTFTFTVTDSNAMTSAAATVTIPLNTPPTANPASVSLSALTAGPQGIPALTGTATSAGATLASVLVTALPTMAGVQLLCNGTAIVSVPAACTAAGLSVTVTGNATGTTSFPFEMVDSNGMASAPAIVTLHITASAALALAKTSAGPMTVGFPAVYRLQVSNKSPGTPTSAAISVVDVLPPGLDYRSAGGAATPSGWNCTWSAPIRTVACTSSAVLAPGQDAEALLLTVIPNAAAIGAGLNTASISNSATVAGGGELPTFANGTAPGSFPHTSTDVQSVQAAATIAGATWVDLNQNGAKDAGEPVPAAGSVRVEAWPAGTTAAQAAAGAPLAAVMIDPSGSYVLPVPPGNVEIRFVDATTGSTLGTPVNGDTAASHNQAGVTGSNGVVNHGVIDNIHVAPGAAIVQQSLPVDPQGFVYDAGTRLPVGGASVSLFANGAHVPTACLAGGANPYTTASAGGFAGGYQFLVDFSAAGCSTLSGATFTLSVSAAGMRFPSNRIAPGSPAGATFHAPPGVGFAPIVAKAGIPGLSDPTTYYLAVVLSSGAKGIVNNNLPLDASPAGQLALSKLAARSAAEIGDTVRYTLVVRNTGSTSLPGVHIADHLPLGFKLIPGSVILTGGPVPQTLAVAATGPELEIPLPTLAGGGQFTVQYVLRVGIGADRGDGINRAVASAGTIRSSEALARVAVSGGVFGSDACIAGKVIRDCNGDGMQGAGEGGVPGVRLWTETGLSILSDAQGRYAVCGVAPGSHVLRLDPLTIPPGAQPVATSNRNLGDAASVLVDTKPGELARADFALGQCKAGATARTVNANPTGPRDMIAVGVIDGVISASHLRAGAIQPANRSDGFEQEIQHWSRSLGSDGSADGRAALFLKGRIAGDALLTAAYDSDKDTRHKLAQTVDPNAVYPVYGDDSVLGFEAQSGSRLYVRVDRDHSFLLYGDFSTTGLAPGGQATHPSPATTPSTDAVLLGRYNRTATGIRSHWSAERGNVDGFVIDDTLRQVVEEYPANGTSGPFAVRNGNAVQNSERVEVLVRDRNQRGVIRSVVTLVRFLDYTFEPFSGRILLNQPLASLTPAGDPNSLRITYEVDDGGSPFFTWGLSGSLAAAPGVNVGATNVEDRDPLSPYRLHSANADLALGDHGRIRAEVAQADSSRFQANGQTYASPNGLAAESASGVSGNAARIEAEYRDGAVESRAWVIKADEGFDNPSSGVVPGRTDGGAHAKLGIDARSAVYGEFTDSRDAASETGREAARAGVQRIIDERLTLDLSLREVHDNAAFPAQAVVGANAAAPSAGGNGSGGFFGTGTTNTVIDPLTGAPVNTLAPTGMANSATPGRDLRATTARAEATWRQSDALTVHGGIEASLTDDARHAADVGAELRTSEHERVYAHAETQTGLASPSSLAPADHSNAVVVGVTRDASEQTAVFSEYRLSQSSADNVPGAMGQMLANGLHDTRRIDGDWRSVTTVEAIKALAGSQREALATAVALDNGGRSDWRAAAKFEARRLFDDHATPGDQTQTQWLTTITLAHRLDGDWTLLLKDYWMLQANHDDATGNAIGDARQERMLVGFAWRPVGDNRINGLARYEFRSVSDSSQLLGDHYQAHILAATMDWHPLRRWWATGRVGIKHDDDQNLPAGAQAFNAWLLGMRFTWDATEKIDLGAMASTLRQNAGTAAQSALGVEAGYRVVNNMWMSTGFNWTGFTDRDLAASDYTQRGVYLRLRAKFDENVFH